MNINPYTVLKGMNLLVDEGIIYRIRELGMFVKTGAVEKILRRQAFTYVAITFRLTIILIIPVFFELIVPHN
ncbi:hypothetical protein NDGK_01550 [Clostridiales bacterium CHKCI001]|nr:hypothetical protein NDGK_01550 [Clostridiales bacterium CHKCI001]